MRRALLVLTVCLLGCHASAQPPELLRRKADIDLANVEGRFDHFAIDVEGKRLFVTALGNNSLEVIDVAGNKRMQSIPNLKKPTGSAYIPRLKRLAVASGDDGMC